MSNQKYDNLRAAMKDRLGFDDLEDFMGAYEGIVEILGYENIKSMLPADDETIREAYKQDVHLNNIPLKLWDINAGWTTRGASVTPIWNAPLLSMLTRDLGVRAISNSQCVCILKACARMLATGKTKGETA